MPFSSDVKDDDLFYHMHALCKLVEGSRKKSWFSIIDKLLWNHLNSLFMVLIWYLVYLHSNILLQPLNASFVLWYFKKIQQ